MHADTSDESCLLCRCAARYTRGPFGDRIFCECSNRACGNYEFTRRARLEIERNPGYRKTFSEEAHELRAFDRRLRITVDPDGLIQRDSAPDNHPH